LSQSFLVLLPILTLTSSSTSSPHSLQTGIVRLRARSLTQSAGCVKSGRFFARSWPGQVGSSPAAMPARVSLIDELDSPFSWDDSWPPRRRRMSTIRDFADEREEAPVRSPSRDSMPTLPDIDPLRHDL